MLFDLNRSEIERTLLKRSFDAEVAALFANAARTYRLDPRHQRVGTTRDAVARVEAPHAT